MMRHLTRRHSIFASQAASALESSCELPLHSVLPSILSRLPAAQGAPAPGTLRGLGTAAFPALVQTGPEAPKASRDVRSGPLPSGSGGGGRNMGPVLLLPAAIAAGLGAWQLARRREKQTMLDHRLAAMQEEPVDVDVAGGTAPEFTPAYATGVLDEPNTIAIGPRVRSAMGATIGGKLVVTPLRDDTRGSAAIVIRGWAPSDWQPPSSPAHQVRVEGVLRSSEQRGRFVPDNVPGSGPRDPHAHWYWLDGPAIARATGLPPDTPLLEQVAHHRPQSNAPSTMDILGGRTASVGAAATPSYPSPRAREELVLFPLMPEGHLNYAATWLTLSACIGTAGLMAMRKQRRLSIK